MPAWIALTGCLLDNVDTDEEEDRVGCREGPAEEETGVWRRAEADLAICFCLSRAAGSRFWYCLSCCFWLCSLSSDKAFCMEEDLALPSLLGC